MPLSPPFDLDELCELSAMLGDDLTLVQGAGGNTSIKDGGVLWVKASGTWLRDASSSDIFLPLDLAKVRQGLQAGDDDCAAGAVLGGDARRASIEASVHAVLPQRVIVHVHCVETIHWAILRDGRREVGKRLENIAWSWIPYRRPGAPLAREIVAQLRESGRESDVLILENHGIVVCGASCASAEATVRLVHARLKVAPRSTALTRSDKSMTPPAGYAWTDDDLIAVLAFDPVAQSVASGGVLYPDHAVFLGMAFPIVRAGEDAGTALVRWRAVLGAPPLYLVVPKVGVLVQSEAVLNATAMLQCLGLVTSRITEAELTAGVHYLAPNDVAALLNWDAEAYRRQLAAQAQG